jgi:hypothetical protein
MQTLTGLYQFNQIISCFYDGVDNKYVKIKYLPCVLN